MYSDKTRELRRQKMEQGICLFCDEKSGKFRLCPKCRVKDVEQKQRRIQLRDELGVCRKCGRVPPREGAKNCEACLVKINAYTRKHARKRMANKLCLACKKPSGGAARCEECKVKSYKARTALQAKRKAEGLCRECPEKAILVDRSAVQHQPGGPRSSDYCRTCYLKLLAGNVLGSRTRWQELVDILNRADWRCAYTGEELILGVNLSLDHINPICRFPEQKHDASNVEPVTLEVNLMKRHMTKKEFLDLIRRIAAHVAAGE